MANSEDPRPGKGSQFERDPIEDHAGSFSAVDSGEDPHLFAGILPPALEVIPKMLALIQNPDVNSEEILGVIRPDAGLTADVLRVCNSAAFGGWCRTETLSAAVNHVGLREVYRIALKVAASPWFLKVQENGLDKLDLWQHSLCTAITAQILGPRSGEDSEIAYTAGLLHDVGKLVLWQEFGPEYTILLEHSRMVHRPALDAERERFGIDHAAVGGRILSEWSLPENITSAVAFHHELIVPGKFNHLSGLIHTCNIVAHAIQDARKEHLLRIAPRLLEAHYFRPAEFDEIQAEVKRRFVSERALLRV